MRGVRVVDEKLVAAAHAAGLQVHAWTVNQPEEMRRLLDFGVDGVITDRPDLLKEVLIERGEWKQ
jgi:glycerophosphoryl diester phosphodiesterase